jgi:hypothetical protein
MDEFSFHPFKPFCGGTTKAVGEIHETMWKTFLNFHFTGDPDSLNRSNANNWLNSSHFGTVRRSV